jgi:hypothetical protein
VAAQFTLVIPAFTGFSFMLQLTTILNRCHRFAAFVYHHAPPPVQFRSRASKSLSVRAKVRRRFVRAAISPGGYDYLAERRFEFIPFWGLLVFLVYSMCRVDCRRCEAVVVEELRWAAAMHADPRLLAVSGPQGAQTVLEGNGRGLSHLMEKVFDAVEYVVTFGLEHRVLGQIDAIGMDEIQHAKGHKYLTEV